MKLNLLQKIGEEMDQKKNEKIKNFNKKYSFSRSKRLKISMLVAFVVFFLLVFRIGWIQFVDGKSYKESAYKQQTINRIISPKRGTIYDSTGKSLAISAQVDTVTINPSSIESANKEKVAKAFADIFELNYDEVLQKVNSDSSLETIIKKVEKTKIDQLKEWMKTNNISSGINIDEDSKRYYPYNNLASNLIGFCGNDNQGLEGLESTWDSTLAGTAGKIITSRNAAQQEIPDENQTYIAAENGSNLVLTLDINIQSIIEKYLKQAVVDNNCSRGGTAIVMDPNTGDILGMASYPDYNLNTPFEPNTDSLKKSWDTMSSSEKTASLQKMWRNGAVADTYEPGSTFKIITSSIALEEGLITTDKSNDFLCTGYQKVADYDIACWRSYNPHGYQSLRMALENSCNPAFIQLGQKIGATTFYRYLQAFGFFNKTGANIAGETSGIFHSLNKVGPTELATMSFGQRFEVTPLQLITAVSSVANDGVLMQPRIVKQIVNADTGATTDTETVQVREVISKETSEKMRDLLESVVTEGTGRYAAVKGYSVGGKTGTSEPSPGKEDLGYTASYVAISPTVNTQVAILVTLYDPKGDSHQGGQVAGPVVSQMLTEILPYLGIPSDETGEEGSGSNGNNVTLPDIRNKTVTEAEKILKAAGFNVQISSVSNKNEVLVTDQVPKPGASLATGSKICLYTAENDTRVSVTVPNLSGMTASQATNSLKAKNLNINLDGTGKVISQDPAADTTCEEGTIIKVTLKDEIKDAH